VKVFTSAGAPITGARITGWIYTSFSSWSTDSLGIAHLPNEAKGHTFVISKDNYLPNFSDELQPGQYILHGAPVPLDSIGPVEGRGVFFDSSMLTTIVYQGTYNVYEHSDEGVQEIAVHNFPVATRGFKVRGDTLWEVSHADGIFAYSIENPSNPDLLFQLDVPGYLWALEVIEDIVILGDSKDPGPLQFLEYNSEGQVVEVSSVQNIHCRKLSIIADHLIIRGVGILYAFDIQDLANPQLSWSRTYQDVTDISFVIGSKMIWQKQEDSGWRCGTDYLILDLADPTQPPIEQEIYIQAYVDQVVGEHMLIGRLGYPVGSTVILNGDLESGYSIQSVVYRRTHYFNEGNFTPYYLFGDILWKERAIY